MEIVPSTERSFALIGASGCHAYELVKMNGLYKKKFNYQGKYVEAWTFSNKWKKEVDEFISRNKQRPDISVTPSVQPEHSVFAVEARVPRVHMNAVSYGVDRTKTLYKVTAVYKDYYSEDIPYMVDIITDEGQNKHYGVLTVSGWVVVTNSAAKLLFY